MGRKIEMKRIENGSKRNATFSQRRTGLLKKADELGVLCDSQVAVIIFSGDGQLSEFCNSSMEDVLARYNSLKSSKDVAYENKPEEENLDNMTQEELENLEMRLSETLLLVKDRKEQLAREDSASLLQNIGENEIMPAADAYPVEVEGLPGIAAEEAGAKKRTKLPIFRRRQ